MYRTAPFRGLALVAALVFAPACSDDDASASDAGHSTGGTTDTPASTGGPADTGQSTGAATTGVDTSGSDDGSGSDSGDPGGPTLGQTTNARCEAVVAAFDQIATRNASGAADPVVVGELYLGADGSGTELQAAVQAFGGELGRVTDGVLDDDAAILDALGDGSDLAMVDIETRIEWVLVALIRKRTGDVASAIPDMDRPPELLYADWDEAYCYYDGILRRRAMQADALGLEVEGIDDDIQGGFELGHSGIESEEASFAIDEWVVPPAKQIVEKSLFRAYDRIIVEHATAASSGGDELEARRALGYFHIIADRFAGKNTPGIAILEADLSGNPSNIDPAIIQRELDVVWIRRTRTYASIAVEEALVGTPSGYAGATEGRTYAKIALPRMVDALDGFDGAAYLQTFGDYADAIRDDDFPTAMELSVQLVEANCAFQTHLGIAECGSGDVGG